MKSTKPAPRVLIYEAVSVRSKARAKWGKASASAYDIIDKMATARKRLAAYVKEYTAMLERTTATPPEFSHGSRT
jgi:hypothetical protein